MTMTGLCAVCRSTFHGNCKPYVCRECNSLTHRRCSNSRPKTGTDYYCIQCVDASERKAVVHSRILPPGRPPIPSEDPEIKQELAMSVQRSSHVDHVDPQATEQGQLTKSPQLPSGQVAITVDDILDQSFDSESSSTNSETSSSTNSETSSPDIEVPENCKSFTQPILKSLISGVRGNFLAFLIVLIVLLCVFLAFICFTIFVGNRNIAIGPFMQESSTALPLPIPYSARTMTKSVSATNESVNFSMPILQSTEPSFLRRMVSFTEFACTLIPDKSILNSDYVCINDTFQLCVIVNGSVPLVPTEIVPVPKSSIDFERVCSGRNVFTI